MKLERYVRNNYKTVAEAARCFGVSRQYLYELFKDGVTPHPSTAKRIERITGGKVKAANLLGV